MVGNALWLPFGESFLEVTQLQGILPVVLVRRPKDLEDPEDLVNFRIAVEQRLFLSKFSKDTTDAPGVNWDGVSFLAEQDLWGSVPQGHYFMGQGLDGNAEGSRQSKVGELDLSFFRDKNILRFKVSVHNSVGVAVVDSLDDLVDETLD